MICELCKREENLEDNTDELIFVGVCGGCEKITVCGDCINTHIETCVDFQMILKESAILQ